MNRLDHLRKPSRKPATGIWRSEVRSPDHSTSLAEQTSHPSQNAVLLRVIGVIFAGNLENGRKGGRVGINAVSDLVGNLRNSVNTESGRTTDWYHIHLTCWLMRMIPISFRSMNLSKADSIEGTSVFSSTTRKFFSASALLETC